MITIPPPAKNRWPCLLWLPYRWSPYLCLLWLPYRWSPYLYSPKTGDQTWVWLLFCTYSLFYKRSPCVHLSTQKQVIRWSPCPLRLKTCDHAYFGYQESGLCSLHMVFFINGHHVYPSTLKNRWPCLLWSLCIAHYPKKQVTMLTLVTIQVVNIPHRLKTDDHAYFGYQGSGLCCLHIFFLYSVTMYSPLHMGFECDPSSVRHLRR